MSIKTAVTKGKYARAVMYFDEEKGRWYGRLQVEDQDRVDGSLYWREVDHSTCCGPYGDRVKREILGNLKEFDDRQQRKIDKAKEVEQELAKLAEDGWTIEIANFAQGE